MAGKYTFRLTFKCTGDRTVKKDASGEKVYQIRSIENKYNMKGSTVYGIIVHEYENDEKDYEYAVIEQELKNSYPEQVTAWEKKFAAKWEKANAKSPIVWKVKKDSDDPKDPEEDDTDESGEGEDDADSSQKTPNLTTGAGTTNTGSSSTTIRGSDKRSFDDTPQKSKQSSGKKLRTKSGQKIARSGDIFDLPSSDTSPPPRKAVAKLNQSNASTTANASGTSTGYQLSRPPPVDSSEDTDGSDQPFIRRGRQVQQSSELGTPTKTQRGNGGSIMGDIQGMTGGSIMGDSPALSLAFRPGKSFSTDEDPDHTPPRVGEDGFDINSNLSFTSADHNLGVGSDVNMASPPVVPDDADISQGFSNLSISIPSDGEQPGIPSDGEQPVNPPDGEQQDQSIPDTYFTDDGLDTQNPGDQADPTTPRPLGDVIRVSDEDVMDTQSQASEKPKSPSNEEKADAEQKNQDQDPAIDEEETESDAEDRALAAETQAELQAILDEADDDFAATQVKNPGVSAYQECSDNLIEAYEEGIYSLVHTAMDLEGMPCDKWVVKRKNGKYEEMIRRLWVMIVSWDPVVLKFFVSGTLDEESKNNPELAKRLRSLSNIPEREYPSTYVNYLTHKTTGKALTPDEMEILLEHWGLYIRGYDCLDTDSAEFAAKVDSVRGKPASILACKEGKRKYIDSTKNLNICRVWAERVEERLAGCPKNVPLTRPISEVGYASHPKKRLKDHAEHRSSNFLMNLAEAICEVVPELNGYKIAQHIIHHLAHSHHAKWDEILASRIGLAYINQGGGFSHWHAGTNNAGSDQRIPASHYRAIQQKLRDDQAFIQRLFEEVQNVKDRTKFYIDTTNLSIERRDNVGAAVDTLDELEDKLNSLPEQITVNLEESEKQLGLLEAFLQAARELEEETDDEEMES